MTLHNGNNSNTKNETFFIKFIRFLHGFSYFIAIVGFFWGGIWIIPLSGLIIKYRSADNYKPAVFEVKEVRYFAPSSSETGGSKFGDWYAIGTINGKEEQFSLTDLPQRPKSQEDLESMVSKGDKIDVLYNPEMTNTKVQHETLRVIPFKENHKESIKKSMIDVAILAFPLFFIGVFLIIVLGKIVKKFA